MTTISNKKTSRIRAYRIQHSCLFIRNALPSSHKNAVSKTGIPIIWSSISSRWILYRTKTISGFMYFPIFIENFHNISGYFCRKRSTIRTSNQTNRSSNNVNRIKSSSSQTRYFPLFSGDLRI